MSTSDSEIARGHTSLEEIDRITREFRDSVIQPDGSQALAIDSMRYMQSVNFDIPNLEYDVLCEVPRFLVRTTVFSSGLRSIRRGIIPPNSEATACARPAAFAPRSAPTRR